MRKGDPRVFPVALLGVLLVILPFLLFPSPGNGGPIGFAGRLMQGVVAMIGLGVIGTALYSDRTGNPGPAIAAGTTISGLLIVGIGGGLIETSGGPLIPIWAWLLATVVVIALSLVVTDRFVSREPR